ncbi:MAG TPA: hypothetical protein VKI99_06950 [Candidatus Dormibacteraeota bacterium]|nr:hypothetical protein [Candidatus Dormibacteraeota bacterium]
MSILNKILERTDGNNDATTLAHGAATAFVQGMAGLLDEQAAIAFNDLRDAMWFRLSDDQRATNALAAVERSPSDEGARQLLARVLAHYAAIDPQFADYLARSVEYIEHRRSWSVRPDSWGHIDNRVDDHRAYQYGTSRAGRATDLDQSRARIKRIRVLVGFLVAFVTFLGTVAALALNWPKLEELWHSQTPTNLSSILIGPPTTDYTLATSGPMGFEAIANVYGGAAIPVLKADQFTQAYHKVWLRQNEATLLEETVLEFDHEAGARDFLTQATSGERVQHPREHFFKPSGIPDSDGSCDESVTACFITFRKGIRVYSVHMTGNEGPVTRQAVKLYAAAP